MPELTGRQLDIECYINMYKSTHNVKPYHINFSSLSDEEIQQLIINHETKDSEYSIYPDICLCCDSPAEPHDFFCKGCLSEPHDGNISEEDNALTD